MSCPRFVLAPLPRFPVRLALVFGVACLAIFVAGSVRAFSLNGKSWASGEIVLRLGLPNPVAPLLDGNTSYSAAVGPALEAWSSNVGRVHLSAVNGASAVSTGDHVNSVVFTSTIFGQAFGSGTLAVTYYVTQGTNMIEADVLFNSAQTFDSYRGPLRFGGAFGFALADIRRILLHELGHAIGLNHSNGDNIMAPIVSDRESLSNDDIAGAQWMYGAPIAPPPPPAVSRLANISTRMRVGVDDNVLIGGFIVRGSESQRILLRATGPSMAGTIGETLADPTLELYDSAGSLLMQNDNWQSGSQVAEISASSLAPTHALEPALVVTLSAGSYTAMVRGANGAQGIALVEGYELGTNSTRLTNLSTRGRIGVGDEVLIGGVIIGGTVEKAIIVRAIGPSMAAAVAGTLGDPALELYNADGQLIASNDNWGSSPQRDEIIDSTVPPTHGLESAIVARLIPGNYTAIVRGVNNTTGIGLVEVFDLEP